MKDPTEHLNYNKRMKVILLLLFAGMVTPTLQLTAQEFYHTGNEEPVETNHLPGLVLAGGATDNNDAMKWMLERADGGDVVVLRANTSDLYNSYFYAQLGVNINSVTTIVIQSEAHANREEVVNILNNAEVVFIAGGNQWNYVDYWRDSALLDALNALINEKQITIGGTSAGMAVLGEVVFTAENATVWSSEALSNPYHWRVKLEKDFLDVPFMLNTVTDSHYNRIEGGTVRKGRHVAFMARMVADWDMPAKGIAANEYTAIAVDENGKARVFGHPNYPDYAYFLKKYGGPPEVCEEGMPLTWNQSEQAIKVYKVKGDFAGSRWFDIDGWEEGEGGEWQYWYVDEGELFETDADDETSITPPYHTAEEAIRLYPNPASDKLNVSIDKSFLPLNNNPVQLRILKPDGAVVHAIHPNGETSGFTNTQSYSINIEQLPAGLYILEVDDGRHSHAVRWVKQ